LNKILNKKSVALLFLEIDNCSSCIYKGLNELNNSSYEGIIIVINNNPDYFRGWVENLEFKNIYIISKNEFYENIKCPYLPVLVLIKDLKIENIRYIN